MLVASEMQHRKQLWLSVMSAGSSTCCRYPIGGCCKRVLRLLASEAAILNSRDKVEWVGSCLC